MALTKKKFAKMGLSEQQKAMIDSINAEMDAADPEPESYAPNLNISPLAMHIRVINFSLWSM
ncbi:hypothetical protein CNR33_00016 [Pseudomonas phage tabernarius]|uniref:Uncharacterized protein n=1 Tax=Pseudomonas phage tabernarius TaxID=2048978 RepID=A0A2H4P6R0_9CAUD|nr:hypothetical protein FDJ17_gp16 [Pseudomonas phage tabernarius]ATW57862.1 hypothetical protein CNR33_00016 [Pseudomonas phage tabernarius]